MSNQLPLSDKIARRYAAWTGKRPFLTLALILPVIVLAGWYGSGIQIRSNMEDLFPDHTPAVVAAKHARETLKSSSQMVIVIASANADANHKLAANFATASANGRTWPPSNVAAISTFFATMPRYFCQLQNCWKLKKTCAFRSKKRPKKIC